MHNDNTPHAVPSIAAKSPDNYALPLSDYPHMSLKTNKHTQTHKYIDKK